MERIGARSIVHFGDGATAFKAVFENDVPAVVGEMVRILPHPEAVRLFDAATGQALGG